MHRLTIWVNTETTDSTPSAANVLEELNAFLHERGLEGIVRYDGVQHVLLTREHQEV